MSFALPTRSLTLPIAIIAVLGLLTFAIMALPPPQSVNGAVKVFGAIVIAIAAVAVICYRPVIFPLAAYLFMVPFDTLLQTGAGTITKFLGVAAAAVILIVLMDRRRTVTPPLAVVAWSAYLLWNVASLMWSQDPTFHSELLVATVELFALYVIISMLRVSAREVKTLLAFTLGGGIALSGFGLWLFLHGTDVMSGASSSRLSISMSKTSVINSDHFAAALVLPIALAIVAALHNHGWRKVLYAAITLMLLGGIFVSGTRGALIAVGVMCVYLAVFYGYRRQIAAIALAGLAFSAAFPNMWMRFLDPSQGEAGGRYGIWAIAWDAFKQHWMIGIGSGQFRLAYAESYLRIPTSSMNAPWFEDAHNIIAANGVELGIVGLVLVLAAWFYQVRVARNVTRLSPLFHVRMALEAATVGLFINALSLDILFYKYLWIAFVLGVLIRNAAVGVEHSKREAAAAAVALPVVA
jgi:O-antigen ligase